MFRQVVQLYRRGHYAEAIPLGERALAICKQELGEAHPDVATSLNNLAGLLAATTRSDEALAHMESAMAIDDRMLGQIFSCGSENQRMAYLQTLQGNFYAFLSLVLQNFSASPAILATALELVLRRKALGMEALRMQQEVVLGGGRIPRSHLRCSTSTSCACKSPSARSPALVPTGSQRTRSGWPHGRQRKTSSKQI